MDDQTQPMGTPVDPNAPVQPGPAPVEPPMGGPAAPTTEEPAEQPMGGPVPVADPNAPVQPGPAPVEPPMGGPIAPIEEPVQGGQPGGTPTL